MLLYFALNTITSIHQLPAWPSFATVLPLLHAMTTTPHYPHTHFFVPPHTVVLVPPFSPLFSPVSGCLAWLRLNPATPHPSPLYQMSLQLWRVDAGRGRKTKGQGGGLGAKQRGEAIFLWTFSVCKTSATGLAEKLRKGQKPLKSRQTSFLKNKNMSLKFLLNRCLKMKQFSLVRLRTKFRSRIPTSTE